MPNVEADLEAEAKAEVEADVRVDNRGRGAILTAMASHFRVQLRFVGSDDLNIGWREGEVLEASVW